MLKNKKKSGITKICDSGDNKKLELILGNELC
jgi:hypothetical protein